MNEDLERIIANVEALASKGAPEDDIAAYVAEEGYTLGALEEFAARQEIAHKPTMAEEQDAMSAAVGDTNAPMEPWRALASMVPGAMAAAAGGPALGGLRAAAAAPRVIPMLRPFASPNVSTVAKNVLRNRLVQGGGAIGAWEVLRRLTQEK